MRRELLRLVAGAVGAITLLLAFVFLYRHYVPEARQWLGRFRFEKALLHIQRLDRKLDQDLLDPHLGATEKKNLAAEVRVLERRLLALHAALPAESRPPLYPDSLGCEVHEVLADFGEEEFLVPGLFLDKVRRNLLDMQRTPVGLHAALSRDSGLALFIRGELKRAGLPSVFLYLAMHESALDTLALSRMGARGLWQFMPGTARDLGLSVPDGWDTLPPELDERTSPARSTQAAIRCFRALLRQFGSIPLTVAAYNLGAGRLEAERDQVQDPGNRGDFWFLYRSGALSGETREFFARIVATMVIAENRRKYHF